MSIKDLVIIAVDPGYSNGGIAWIKDNKAVAIKMPDTEEGIKEALGKISDMYPFDRCIAIVEQVHASPQAGASSGFKFGEHYGLVKTYCECIFQQLDLITPQKWQAALNCRTSGNKNVSKARAQDLFPDMKITLATADALLLAYYGYTKYVRE